MSPNDFNGAADRNENGEQEADDGEHSHVKILHQRQPMMQVTFRDIPAIVLTLLVTVPWCVALLFYSARALWWDLKGTKERRWFEVIRKG